MPNLHFLYMWLINQGTVASQKKINNFYCVNKVYIFALLSVVCKMEFPLLDDIDFLSKVMNAYSCESMNW